MKKVKIRQEFHDINDYSKVYKVGEIHEFTNDRASHLIELGVAMKVETETNPKRSKKEK